MMVMKTTLAQDCKNFNSTCSLHVNHPQLLKRNIFFLYLCFWSLAVKYLCKCNMYFCKNTVPGRASADLLRDFLVLGACQTSYDVRPGTVRCPVGHRLNRRINVLNKNRPVPVRCVQTPPGRCHFTLNEPTKRRMGAVEF